VIPYSDNVVDGTVGVVLGRYRRKRCRCDRGGPRHCEQNRKCVLCSAGTGERSSGLVSFGSMVTSLLYSAAIRVMVFHEQHWVSLLAPCST
jgi:hypothetical protein